MPGLARARGLPLGPRRDARRDDRALGARRRLRDRLHLERFQPIIGQGDGEHGEGGTIRFLTQRRRGVRATAPSRSSSPARRPARRCPSAAGWASATRASGKLCAGQDPRPAHRRGLAAATARSCAPASTRPRAPSRSPCDTDHGRSRMPSMIESPLARLSDEQIEELGREFDAIHDEVFAELGDRDRRYIVSMIEMHRRLVVLGRVLLLASRCRPAWLAGTTTALAGQDPREHGDRPQRHARPVGLDERSPDQLLDLGLGLGLDRRGVEALPQLRPPHLHEHPRQGPRSRLRDHAHRPAPEVASGLPAAAVLQPGAGGVLRVGRRLPRPRLRGDQEGREVQGAARARAQGHAAQGPRSRSSRTTSPGR